MKNIKTLSRRFIIGFFISVPVLSSLISTIHLIDFFNLGNTNWISFVLAFAFEIGAVSSFLVLTLFPRINKIIVWSILLGILFPMQVIGNVYSSFEFINRMLVQNPNWLSSINELINTFIEVEPSTTKTILAFIIGVPIPTLSVFLLKSTVSAIEEESNIEKTEENQTQEISNLESVVVEPEIIEPEIIEEIKVEKPKKKKVQKNKTKQVKEKSPEKKKQTIQRLEKKTPKKSKPA